METAPLLSLLQKSSAIWSFDILSEYEKTVAFIGLGYIGLPTALMLAANGVSVIGVDIKTDYIERLSRGELPINEPGLQVVFDKAIADEKIRFQTTPPVADCFVIAVPTPFLSETKKPDLSYVFSAIDSIAPVLKSNSLIVIESTCPPGATTKALHHLREARPELKIADGTPDSVSLAYCPERVLPGNIINELKQNSRIIGGVTQKCSQLAVDLYSTFCEAKLITTSSSTAAEMIKLTENSFRDVNIAFANELSMVCDDLSLNVSEVISGANLHPRVNILTPGPGVGGHCIAVDPWFIVDASPKHSTLISTARQVNLKKMEYVISKVDKHLSHKNFDNIIIYGLTYKPNVDDLRESPAKYIHDTLVTKYANKRIFAVEPNIPVMSSLSLSDAEELEGLHVFLVKHDEFENVSNLKGSILSFI